MLFGLIVPYSCWFSVSHLKGLMELTKPRQIHIPHLPHTPKQTVTDIVHGVLIEDPYRWLENGQSPETRAWTQAQNQRTEAVMGQLVERDLLGERMTELMSQDTVDRLCCAGANCSTQNAYREKTSRFSWL